MRLERIGEQLDAFRDEVARKWSKLTKSDLAEVDHDLASLSGVLARRYSLPAGKAREEAESFMASFGTTFKEAANLVGDAARDLWRNGKGHVVDAVQAGSEKVGDFWDASRQQVDDLQKRARRAIHDKPVTSLAVAAGVGALLALWMRRR